MLQSFGKNAREPSPNYRAYPFNVVFGGCFRMAMHPLVEDPETKLRVPIYALFKERARPVGHSTMNTTQ